MNEDVIGVKGGRSHPLAVGRPSRSQDGVFMAAEFAKQLAGPDVVDSQVMAVLDRQLLAVRRPRDDRPMPVITDNALQQFAGGDIPDAQESAAAQGGQP